MQGSLACPSLCLDSAYAVLSASSIDFYAGPACPSKPLLSIELRPDTRIAKGKVSHGLTWEIALSDVSRVESPASALSVSTSSKASGSTSSEKKRRFSVSHRKQDDRAGKAAWIKAKLRSKSLSQPQQRDEKERVHISPLPALAPEQDPERTPRRISFSQDVVRPLASRLPMRRKAGPTVGARSGVSREVILVTISRELQAGWMRAIREAVADLAVADAAGCHRYTFPSQSPTLRISQDIATGVQSTSFSFSSSLLSSRKPPALSFLEIEPRSALPLYISGDSQDEQEELDLAFPPVSRSASNSAVHAARPERSRSSREERRASAPGAVVNPLLPGWLEQLRSANELGSGGIRQSRSSSDLTAGPVATKQGPHALLTPSRTRGFKISLHADDGGLTASAALDKPGAPPSFPVSRPMYLPSVSFGSSSSTSISVNSPAVTTAGHRTSARSDMRTPALSTGSAPMHIMSLPENDCTSAEEYEGPPLHRTRSAGSAEKAAKILGCPSPSNPAVSDASAEIVAGPDAMPGRKGLHARAKSVFKGAERVRHAVGHTLSFALAPIEATRSVEMSQSISTTSSIASSRESGSTSATSPSALSATKRPTVYAAPSSDIGRHIMEPAELRRRMEERKQKPYHARADYYKGASGSLSALANAGRGRRTDALDGFGFVTTPRSSSSPRGTMAEQEAACLSPTKSGHSLPLLPPSKAGEQMQLHNREKGQALLRALPPPNAKLKAAMPARRVPSPHLL